MITEHRQGTGELRIISATAPTQRSDGTPLTPAEISHYNWSISYQGEMAVVQPTQLIDGKFIDAVDVDTVAAGTYTIWYTTVDTDGRESTNSDILTLTILPPLTAPNPPTNIS